MRLFAVPDCVPELLCHFLVRCMSVCVCVDASLHFLSHILVS